MFCQKIAKENKMRKKVVSLRRPAINKVMFFFTQLGRFSGVVVVMIALALIPGFWWKVVRPAGIALTISWWLAFAMKRGMKRPRPEGKRLTEETDHSFPSFHATCSAALYLSLALGSWALYPQLAFLLVAAAVTIAGLIGFSRIYLGVHFLTDVLGGWLFGSGVTLLVWAVLAHV
ncbi:phosphatase PAP2 family protein [Enterococcus sp. MJM12]|uniref:Phosphatase PAP2 family protein n=1 Tax=Candidatus Enterococcus myersii TaxID=2815322 RepID=A0ABS3HAC2_9ENTE|nr:phosphatase PAP2 family protein [Enterococcus sp. MJM12]MBO0450406.1 phosphatase PAP2 family protein [Enterococcus sp. MJM12]